jgi:hypothetical protein
MASKLFYHDIDLVKVGILKDARINPLTTSARTTLAGGLGASHKGLAVWDTDLSQILYWDGSAFVGGVAPITGAMTYKGTHSSLTTTPSSPVEGDSYVLTSAGTLTWTSQTFSPSAVVQVGDIIIYRGSSTWDIVQGNSVAATETVAGVAELATQSETNTGTNDVTIVTPLKLATYCSNRGFARVYFASGVSLTANTAFTVSHNLALQNKDAFTISVKDSSGSEVSVDVDSVDVNSCTVTSSVSVSSFTITVVGF